MSARFLNGDDYHAPHFPIETPKDAVAYFRKKGNLSEKKAVFCAMVKQMDNGIGRVLNKVKDCGIEEDTIVIFTSDNAPALRGLIGVERYNCNLHGEKKYVYEGGLEEEWKIEREKQVEKDRLARIENQRISQLESGYKKWI